MIQFSRCSRFISICILLIILPALYSQEEPVVREIVINGLRTVDRDEALAVMTTKVGEPSSPEKRAQDINSILEMGRFSENIRFYKEEMENGIRIIVDLHENPVVEEIVIVGNSHFKASQIKGKIPFSEGDILPTNGVIKARLAVERLYTSAGYKNAHVKVKVDDLEEGKALVTVVIDEGEKILIKDLVIKGNESYSSFRLRFLLENKGTWLFIKNYYDETTFDDDLETLRRFYINRGYLDVVVKRGKPEYNEKKGWIKPVIIIEEGPRYEVNDVIVEDVTLFTREEVTDPFERMIGEYFKASRYRKSLEKLQKLYGDEGYINMEAQPDFDRLPGKDAVNLILNIDEGERIYLGKIKVRRRGFARGEPENFVEKIYDKFAPPPKDEVILREVTMEPGDVYRSFKEVRTVERLKRLEVFENVAVIREPTEERNVRDMVVSVRESDTGVAGIGVGYGEYPGGFVQLFLRERNLFGDARDLRVNAMLGTRRSYFNATYLDRYFRDTDMSFSWSLYRDRRSLKSHSERIYGTSVEFGKPLSEYVTAYVRGRLEHVNFFDEDDDIITDLDSYPLGTLQFRVIDDHRDDTWWPTRGYVAGAGVEAGYADGPLVKFNADYSWYYNFYKDLIYAMDASAGLIPYDSDEVGLTERFFLGGATDLRGFSYRGAGPKDKGEEDLALGGSTKLLLKNELRFPIAGELKGVLFFDVGMLDKDVGLDTPRASVGTGVRLKISFIRLAVDFAKAVKEEDDDDTRIVHIRLGAAF